jgi:hypothetical protein
VSGPDGRIKVRKLPGKLPKKDNNIENYRGNFPRKIIISSSPSIAMFFFRDVFDAF